MDDLRIVIVEDEAVTARNLAYVLQKLNNHVTVVETLYSVDEAAAWFNERPGSCDLIFMDIRLADGLSFDIFSRTTISCPVIFVTAYNDYAIQAFKNNGIDYILKPFDEKEIDQSLQKFERLTSHFKTTNNTHLTLLTKQINELVKPYKRSFLVHFREKLVPVEAARVSWFYTSNEIVYARLADDRQYVMDFTMEQLEQQLDPQLFFRANRQFIINRQAVSEVDFYFNGRLSVKVKPEPDERILISKARVPQFKTWMNA